MSDLKQDLAIKQQRYHRDISYPPISEALRYQRGDGATVTLCIQPATPTAKAASALQLSPHIQFAPPAQDKHGFAEKKRPEQDAVFDHAAVGGKFTVCVLLYGDYYDMHRQCLQAILRTIPEERLDLRLGSNALGAKSLELVQQITDMGHIAKHYRHDDNRKKYPVMRELFHDPECPITTKWVLWFDDDSLCDINSQWLTVLAKAMIDEPRAALFGKRLYWAFKPEQLELVCSRPWYKKRQWLQQNGQPAARATGVLFASGGFWALRADALRVCDIPDPLLEHNGGDYIIGAQLWQGGFGMQNWNDKKQFVRFSAFPRRGLSEPHFGMRTA